MRSVLNHLTMLQKWNAFYNGKPITYYPNQLYPPGDAVNVVNMINQLTTYLAAKGPIPSR